MRPVVGRIVEGLLHRLVQAACGLGAIWQLLVIWPILRSAHTVVVMEGGGFGHTVTGIEAAQRLFRGASTVFIVLSNSPFHNPRIAALWPDLHIRFLRFLWRLQLGHRARYLGGLTPRMGRRVASVLVTVITRMTRANVLSLAQLYALLEGRCPVEPVRVHMPSVHWVVGWWRLLAQVPAAPLRLPARHREGIYRRMVRANPSLAMLRSRRLCCVYLRGKGSEDITSQRRIGSSVESYFPPIQRLIERGYTVLLTGDRRLDRKDARRFEGRLLSAGMLGVDHETFSVFAATEAELWVGDAGGGSWLPISNHIPMLVVNAFPYGVGIPGAWMYYKTVTDAAGRLVPYDRLFAEHAYDYEMAGMTVWKNSAEQIDAAVESFLDEVSRGVSRNDVDPVMQSLPDHVVAKYVGSRFSKAWLRLFLSREPREGLEPET